MTLGEAVILAAVVAYYYAGRMHRDEIKRMIAKLSEQIARKP